MLFGTPHLRQCTYLTGKWRVSFVPNFLSLYFINSFHVSNCNSTSLPSWDIYTFSRVPKRRIRKFNCNFNSIYCVFNIFSFCFVTFHKFEKAQWSKCFVFFLSFFTVYLLAHIAINVLTYQLCSIVFGNFYWHTFFKFR